jgi:GTP-binding protein HflX
MVFNKIDLEPEIDGLMSRFPGSVAVSAQQNLGIDELLEVVSSRLRSMTELVALAVPYERGDVLAQIHREGQVLSELAGDDGLRVRARLDPDSKGRLIEWIVGDSSDLEPPVQPWEQ